MAQRAENSPIQDVPKTVERRFWFYQMLFNVLMVEVNVIGNPEDIPDRAILAIAPHQSHLDIPAVEMALGSKGAGERQIAVKGAYWQRFRRPLEHIFQPDQCVYIDRDEAKSLLSMSRVFGKRRKNPHTILMMVQGTRDPNETIKPGTAWFAQKYGLDIIPIGLEWSQKVGVKGTNLLAELSQATQLRYNGEKKRVATVKIGQPLHPQVLTTDASKDEIGHAADELHKKLDLFLKGWFPNIGTAVKPSKT